MHLLLAIIAGAFAITIFGEGSNMLAILERECIRSCVARSGDESQCAHHCGCAKRLIGETFTETEIFAFGIRNIYGQKQKHATERVMDKIIEVCGTVRNEPTAH